MKKILFFLLIFCPVIGFSQITGWGVRGGSAINTDSADFRALTVGGSRTLTEADTSEIPFDEQIGMTVWSDDDLIQMIGLVGGDLFAINPFYSLSGLNTGSITDNRARGIWIIVKKDTLLNGVRFEVITAAVGATYDAINGVTIYDSEFNLVATKSTDGTFWNSTGIKSINFDTPVDISAGIYFAELNYNTSAQSSGPAIRILGGTNYYPTFYGIPYAQLGVYRDGASTAPASVTYLFSTTVPVIGLY